MIGRRIWISLCAMLAFTLAAPGGVIWDLTPFTGDDIGVQVLVEDALAADTLKITVSVEPHGAGAIGDLRGIFFNVDTAGTVTTAMFSGDDLTEVCVGSNILSCSGDNNVNGIESNVSGLPAGSFHVGLGIGTSGIGGGDDIQTAVIYFNYGALGLSPESLGPFAARVTSVGALGSKKREGSAKLFGGEGVPTVPDTAPVPEPSTWLMLSAGLLGLGIASRRRFTR